MLKDIMFVDHATTEEQIDYHADRCYNTEDHWDRHELVRWAREVLKYQDNEGIWFIDDRDYYEGLIKEIEAGAVLMPCYDDTSREPKMNRVRMMLHALNDEFWCAWDAMRVGSYH